MATPQAVEQGVDSQAITRLMASKYYLLASVVVLYFEYFLTFDLEVKRLWRRPITGPTILFLLNRYYPLSLYGVVLVGVFAPFWDAEASFKSVPFAAALFSEAMLGAIVILRLVALYGRSFKILALLLPLYILQLLLGGWAADAISRVTGLPVRSGCIVTVPNKFVNRFAWLWGCAAVFDTLVFGLTMYRTLCLRRSGLKMPLIALFLRDGLIYFAVMFSAKLLNFLLFWTAVSSNFVTLNWTFNNIITVIMVNRLVLNLREEASDYTIFATKQPNDPNARGLSLSTFVVSLEQSIVPLEFANPVETEEYEEKNDVEIRSSSYQV